MVDFVVEHVRSEEDYKAAFNLAFSIFAPQSLLDNYKANKIFLWKEDPSFRYENIVVAKYKGKLAGLIRIVPRILFKGDKTLSVAGISSVCILPEFRGKSFSLQLMDYTLDYCKNSGYDLSVLFARRAADYFYTRFGFHGISSYSHIYVKKPKQLNTSDSYSFADWDLSLLEICAQAYDRTYENCFGKFQRSPEYWKFLFSSLSYKSYYKTKVIKFNGSVIGYIIWDLNKVLEIATTEDIIGKEFILFLMENLEILNGDSLQFEMLPQHKMIKQLYGLDITFQSRECIFGGHMLKVLNEEIVSLKLNHRSSTFGIKERNVFLSHSRTCDLLGVCYPSLLKYSDSLIPFDINSIDHF